MSGLLIENLSLHHGRQTVLSDVTLPELSYGSVVGILGPNGVGKSTFMRAIAGQGRADGTISMPGEDLSRPGMIGYLPQTLPQPTTLIAYEAVVSACRAVRSEYGKATVDDAAEEIFTLLGIRHLAFKGMNRLSGGQRQMVGLAQVLVSQPKILLLDEPTSALDLRWQLSVFGLVRSVLSRRDGLCLIALHDINLAMRHCDRIALFADGQLLSFGVPGEAMTPENLRRAYGVEGRVEVCSNGHPFVMTDRVIAPA